MKNIMKPPTRIGEVAIFVFILDVLAKHPMHA